MGRDADTPVWSLSAGQSYYLAPSSGFNPPPPVMQLPAAPVASAKQVVQFDCFLDVSAVGVLDASPNTSHQALLLFWATEESIGFRLRGMGRHQSLWVADDIGIWHDVVLVLDPAQGLITLYVDGLVVGSQSTTVSAIEAFQCYANTPSRKWNTRVRIGEVRVWNAPLSDDDLFAVSSGFPTVDPDGWWSFDVVPAQDRIRGQAFPVAPGQSKQSLVGTTCPPGGWIDTGLPFAPAWGASFTLETTFVLEGGGPLFSTSRQYVAGDPGITVFPGVVLVLIPTTAPSPQAPHRYLYVRWDVPGLDAQRAYHLAVSYDASVGYWGAMSLFLDCEQFGPPRTNVVDQLPVLPAPGNLRLASGSNYGNLSGTMFGARLWNRARTADEIRADAGRYPVNDSDLAFDWVLSDSAAPLELTGNGPQPTAAGTRSSEWLMTFGSSLDVAAELGRGITGRPRDEERALVPYRRPLVTSEFGACQIITSALSSVLEVFGMVVPNPAVLLHLTRTAYRTNPALRSAVSDLVSLPGPTGAATLSVANVLALNGFLAIMLRVLGLSGARDQALTSQLKRAVSDASGWGEDVRKRLKLEPLAAVIAAEKAATEALTVTMLQDRGEAIVVSWASSDDDPWTMLIDGGWSRVEWAGASPPWQPYQAVLGTHSDSDHIAGIFRLLRSMIDARDGDEPIDASVATIFLNVPDPLPPDEEATELAAVLDYLERFDAEDAVPDEDEYNLQGVRMLRQIAAAARELRIPVFGVQAGTPIPGPPTDHVILQTLAPNGPNLRWTRSGGTFLPDPANQRSQAYNRASVVNRLQWKPPAADPPVVMDLVFTGDAWDVNVEETDPPMSPPLGALRKEDIQHALAPIPAVYRPKLLKVPHHGSDHSSDLDFFSRVVADLYLCSSWAGGSGLPLPRYDTLCNIVAGHVQHAADSPWAMYFVLPRLGAARATCIQKLQELVDDEVYGIDPREAGRDYRVAYLRDTVPPGGGVTVSFLQDGGIVEPHAPDVVFVVPSHTAAAISSAQA